MRIADHDDFDGVPPKRALRIVNWLLVAWTVFSVTLIGYAAYELFTPQSSSKCGSNE